MRDLMELIMSQKMTATTVSISFATFFADIWLWLDVNLVKLSAAASFILLILMIVGHFCEIIRKNRSSKIDLIEQELRIEKLRREASEQNQN